MNSYLLILRTFDRNLRAILAAQAMIGLGAGVFTVLLNLFLRSLGFGEGFIGRLLAVQALVAAISALPWGWLADTLSRKAVYCLGIACVSSGSALLLLGREIPLLFGAAALAGIGNGALLVSVQPFLHEASRRRQRPVLFSVNFSLSLMMGILSGFLAGHLPRLLHFLLDLPADSPILLRMTLELAVGGYLLAFLPALRIDLTSRSTTPPPVPSADGETASGVGAVASNPVIARFIVTSLFVGSGAGLIIPFFNLYFRDWVGASVAQIGTVFALGQLGTSLGGMFCPLITRRFSPAGGVVLTQMLSLPFMLLMAWRHELWICTLCFILRGTFMNMSIPMRQELLMSLVGPEKRARAAAADSAAWYFSWAISMMYSGDLIHACGYAPSLFICFFLYLGASVLFHRFFIRNQSATKKAP